MKGRVKTVEEAARVKVKTVEEAARMKVETAESALTALEIRLARAVETPESAAKEKLQAVESAAWKTELKLVRAEERVLVRDNLVSELGDRLNTLAIKVDSVSHRKPGKSPFVLFMHF
jgi:hypothetical protein